MSALVGESRKRKGQNGKANIDTGTCTVTAAGGIRASQMARPNG
jgi:hypothetical protein